MQNGPCGDDDALPTRPAPAPDHCMNCQSTITGRFCSSCGQDHRHRNLAAADLLQNAIEAVFSVESPMWRTVAHMLYKPGRVAADYVSGMRRRYVNPLKYCFACGALAAITVQVLVMLGEGRAAGITSPDMHAEFRVILEWFAQWFHVVYFLSLPLLAVMFRAANPNGGRTVLESLVLCLFVYGQVFLLQIPLMPLIEFVHPWFAYVSSAIGLAYLSWGAAQFYNGRKWLIAVIAAAVHLLHSVILMMLLLILGLIALPMIN